MCESTIYVHTIRRYDGDFPFKLGQYHGRCPQYELFQGISRHDICYRTFGYHWEWISAPFASSVSGNGIQCKYIFDISSEKFNTSFNIRDHAKRFILFELTSQTFAMQCFFFWTQVLAAYIFSFVMLKVETSICTGNFNRAWPYIHIHIYKLY